jgi:hypothetical protein
VTERLAACARLAEELVPLVLELASELGSEAGHGGRHHARLDQILERAVALRSDLKRLARYADPAE